MTDTRGTFRLKNVRQDVLNDEYVSIPNVWLLQDDIAHSRPYPVSTLQRWNLGTSTMSNSTLSCSRYWGQASGNTTFSYFAGGGVSPGITGKTSTDKLSYSPYTFAATPTANTSFPIRSGGALSSNLAAYITAGYNSTGSPSYNGSYVDKILFATDTKSTLSDKFGETGNSWASLSDGKGGGYNFNGDTPSPARPKLYKITYSTDGMAYVPASNTLIARRESSAEMMNPSAGYNTGGDNSGTLSSTEKLSWSTGTWTAVPGGKLVRNTKRQASGSGRSHGFAGGGDGNVSPVFTDFYKLDFSTETFGRDPALNFSASNYGYYPQKSTTTPLDGLYGADKASDRNSFWSGDTGKRWFDGAAQTGNKMYCIGGTSGNDHDTFNMTTETAASLSLPGMPSMNKGATAQNTTNSYIHAGSGKQTKVRKITWSTDTGTTLPGTTSRNAESKSGVGNETKGYFTQGGSSPGPCYSGSDRVTYASDTIERVPGADMVGGRPGKFGAQATGNQETGYFMGGGGEWPGFPNYSDTNKLTYATDTNANCPAQMPTGMSMYSGSSASSSTAAYASNYRNPSFHSKVFKLVFATDTVDTVGNTTVQRNGPAMGGNGTTMYMGGGSNFPNGNRSDFDKLVYATDTFSNLPDANLQSARYYTTGSGQRGERIPVSEPPTATPTASTFPSVNPALNVNAVFAAGASPSSSTNQRSKFTFSNETMASMPAFADSMNTFGGASSTTRGYLSGAFSNTSQGGTENKRWYNQYSNDTSALLPSRTSQNAGGMYSMNDETKLYSGGGGWSGGQYNTAESMPFATESNTGEPGMTLTSPKKYASGIGNKTIGFVCGGNEGNNNRTSIDKVVYSTGTMSRSPSDLTLSGASPYHATIAVGSNTTGFIFQNSPTNKLVFATETVSSAPSNNTANSWGNGTSSVTTGYCMNHPSGQYLIKYVFATETTGTLPSMFSPNRGRGGAMSTAMFGGAYGSTPNLI